MSWQKIPLKTHFSIRRSQNHRGNTKNQNLFSQYCNSSSSLAREKIKTDHSVCSQPLFGSERSVSFRYFAESPSLRRPCLPPRGRIYSTSRILLHNIQQNITNKNIVSKISKTYIFSIALSKTEKLFKGLSCWFVSFRQAESEEETAENKLSWISLPASWSLRKNSNFLGGEILQNLQNLVGRYMHSYWGTLYFGLFFSSISLLYIFINWW